MADISNYRELIEKREEIDKQLEQVKAEVRAEALERVKELIKEFNFTPSELKRFLKPMRKTKARKPRSDAGKPRAKKATPAKAAN